MDALTRRGFFGTVSAAIATLAVRLRPASPMKTFVITDSLKVGDVIEFSGHYEINPPIAGPGHWETVRVPQRFYVSKGEMAYRSAAIPDQFTRVWIPE